MAVSFSGYGGPGRIRTFNQTVMSGRIKDAFVDFAAVLVDFDRVCGGSFSTFLVRNWCSCLVRCCVMNHRLGRCWPRIASSYRFRLTVELTDL